MIIKYKIRSGLTFKDIYDGLIRGEWTNGLISIKPIEIGGTTCNMVRVKRVGPNCIRINYKNSNRFTIFSTVRYLSDPRLTKLIIIRAET